MCGDVAAEECLSVGTDDAVGVEMLVVDDGGETYVARFDGFEREYGMIDGAEYAVGDKYERKIARRDIVDGKEIISDGNHQSSRPFNKHHIVAFKQCFGRAVNDAEVDFASVHARCELSGGGIGEDYGSGRMVKVLGERVDAHQTAVEVDVLGKSGVAGLDEFLGDDAFALFHKTCGEIAGDVAFACVSVNS